MAQKKDIALVTLNKEVYHNIIDELKKRKINFLVKKPGEKIPLSVNIVITTKPEAKLIQHHTVLIYKNVKETIDTALKTINNIPDTSNNKVTIGIDPGKTIGVAILNNGMLIQTASYNNFQEILQMLQGTILFLKPKEMVMKLGNNATLNFRKEVMKNIASLSKDFNIVIEIIYVDETYTTVKAKRRKVKRIVKDETSAIAIALR